MTSPLTHFSLFILFLYSRPEMRLTVLHRISQAPFEQHNHFTKSAAIFLLLLPSMFLVFISPVHTVDACSKLAVYQDTEVLYCKAAP